MVIQGEAETRHNTCRAADSVALGCAALAPRLNFSTFRYSEDIFATGCKPDASEPTLSYKASINNHTRTRTRDSSQAVIRASAFYARKVFALRWLSAGFNRLRAADNGVFYAVMKVRCEKNGS